MGLVVVGEKRVTRTLDVLAGEALGSVGVFGDDGVQDALVLFGDDGGVEQVVGLDLPDAELHLAHQQSVHAGEPGAPRAEHEFAVEEDVVAGEVVGVRAHYWDGEDEGEIVLKGGGPA